MESIEENNAVELPQPEVESDPSLGVQVMRVVVVNVVGFLAGKYAGNIFDKIVAARTQKSQDIIDI